LKIGGLCDKFHSVFARGKAPGEVKIMTPRTLKVVGPIVLLLAAAGLVSMSCVEQPRKMTAKEREIVKPYILDSKPVIQNPLDVNLENHVTLLGYDLEPSGPVKPGQAFTITMYWEVKQPLDEGWLLFTHVEDAQQAPRVNADNEGVIRKHYPPGKWQQGEIIKDVQRITLPSSWDSPTATIKTGIWFGPHRLQVLSGPHDEENRVVVAKVPTTVKAKEVKPLTLRVPRAKGEVVLDGKPDEEAWKGAAESGPMVTPSNGGKMLPVTSFRIMWDDENLYVAYDAPDDLLHCEFKDRDEPIYDQDAVEVFLDPDGDGKNYYEFQVCPAGTIFDSFLPSSRQNQNDWNGTLEAKVSIDGTLNDPDDVDRGYTAEFRIPFKDIENAPSSPPKPGDSWKANFFRLDDAKGGKKAWAWSPPMNNDFHNLSKFGVLEFVGDEPEPAQKAGEEAKLEDKPVEKPVVEAKEPVTAPGATIKLKKLPLESGAVKKLAAEKKAPVKEKAP
jgi:hypothetical protein